MENKLEYYAIRGYEDIVNTIHVNITLTNKCNNNCEYCIGNFNTPRKKYDFLSKDQFSQIIDLLILQERPRISMTLIGGEPTIHNDFSYFLNEVKDIKNSRIYIVTNLLKSYNYFSSLPLNKTFEYICSYHSHGIKNDDEWFSKVDFLYNKGCLSKVFLMLTSKNIKRIKEVYNKYKGRYLKKYTDLDIRDLLIVYPINEFAYSNEYKKLSEDGIFDYFNTYIDCKGDKELNSKDIKVILKDGTNDYLNYDKYKNFYFMMCHCGIAVHPDGRVTRCLHDIAPVIMLGKDKNKKLPKWHLCRQKQCICDLEYPKCSVRYFMTYFKEED